MSYLTRTEKERLQREWGNPSDVLGYDNVSMSQLSIARWSMGCTIGSHRYVYFPAFDELWRDDVLALVHGWRRTDTMAKEQLAMSAQFQAELFLP
jgi:hypothetical protein